MFFIISPSHNAYYNMAMEEKYFGIQANEFLILWQNENAIVVGKYQNTAEEVNSSYVEENGIAVVRRLSGGGAMYQDLGNVNYTFIVNRADTELNFDLFTKIVIDALRNLGVPAEASGRNDITINGKKISGSSQFSKGGRVLHHGTLLFDSNLDVLDKALHAQAGKLESKGIKSVRARVDNIRPYLAKDMETSEFIEYISEYLINKHSLIELDIDYPEEQAIHRLANEKYSTWEWVYGQSPPYTVQRERKFSGGTITAYLVVKNGIIQSVELRGDFFASENVEQLCSELVGVADNRLSVHQALASSPYGNSIYNVSIEELADLLGS